MFGIHPVQCVCMWVTLYCIPHGRGIENTADSQDWLVTLNTRPRWMVVGWWL